MVGRRWVVGWLVVLASAGCGQAPGGDEGGDDTSSAPEASSSEEDDSTSNSGSSSGGEPVDCEGLDEAACSANPACWAVSCIAMQEQPEAEVGWCSAGSVFTHCRAADSGCTAMETGICSGNTLYMCATGCVPSGPEWFECDTSAPLDAPACE